MTKSMKVERKPIPTKNTLEDVPNRTLWDPNDPNAPKPITKEQLDSWKANRDKKNTKTRAGMFYHSIIPGKKSFIVRDGYKLK